MFPPVPTLERLCLSLRERWQRAALTERGCRGRCPHRPALYNSIPALERSCLSPRERWQRRKPLMGGDAGRPEAVPYIFALDCIVNCQLSIVNFPQLFTFHF